MPDACDNLDRVKSDDCEANGSWSATFSFDRVRVLRWTFFHALFIAISVCLSLIHAGRLGTPGGRASSNEIWLAVSIGVAAWMAIRVARSLPLVWGAFRAPRLEIARRSDAIRSQPSLGPPIPADLLRAVTYLARDRMIGRPASLVFVLANGAKILWRCDAIKEDGEAIALRLRTLATI